MGFNPNKTITLVFDDPEWEGAAVKVLRSIPLEDYLELREWKASQDNDEDVGFRHFAEYLAEWNIEDDEENPIPPTYEGLQLVALDFINACVDAWLLAIGKVPDPLAEPSTNGETTPEALDQMDESLLDLASLSALN